MHRVDRYTIIWILSNPDIEPPSISAHFKSPNRNSLLSITSIYSHNWGQQTVALYRGLRVCVCVTVLTHQQSQWLIIHDSLVSDERYFPTFTLVRKNLSPFTWKRGRVVTLKVIEKIIKSVSLQSKSRTETQRTSFKILILVLKQPTHSPKTDYRSKISKKWKYYFDRKHFNSCTHLKMQHHLKFSPSALSSPDYIRADYTDGPLFDPAGELSSIFRSLF
jgi:hypothetical protein